MYTLGIDIGSTACKAVIMKDGTNIITQHVVQIGTGTSGPNRVFCGILEKAGIDESQIAYSIVTGYGRNTFTQAKSQISELSCHSKGAHFLVPEARTIIDIGGQDAKALKLNTQGVLTDFVMNDKCAAGTGRFLDVMAHVLEVGIQDLATIGDKSTHRISISSTCTVFAESEVISQLASGVNRSDIVAGIHMSVAKRIAGLVKRVGVAPRVVMTGGVAQNMGIVNALSEVLKTEIIPVPAPQFTGALGAAILAYEELKKEMAK